MNRLLQLAAASVVLACLAAPAYAQEKYSISLDRPLQVGQKMHVWGEGSQEFTVTATMHGRSQPPEATQSSISFESVAEVLEVDDAGRATRVAHTIRKCEMISDGRAVVIAPKGARLTARRGNGQTIFHVNGTTVDLQQQLMLEVVAGLDTERDTRDELYGTSQPRALGEQWPINADAIAKEFQRYTSTTVRTQDISGTTRLLKVIEHQGEPCQVLHTRLSAQNALPGIGMLPPGVQVKKAKLTAHFYHLLPVAEDRPASGEALTMNIDVVFTARIGPQGARVDTRVSGQIQGRREYTPIATHAEATAQGAAAR
ncbi:MAG: hypothetical protein IH983_09325 [Planctomycetes bacterium]|nr:hypothetical protein [Planctomycetota bacterium]